MENIVEVGLFVVMLCIVLVMFINFFNKRNKISEKFSNVNTRKDNEEKRNTYVRREKKVNVSNNLNSNINNNDRHYRDEDENEYRYHRPIDAGTGLVTGLIVSEIIEDNLKITDVLNNSDKYNNDEVIREVPLSETISKVEENTFDYNSNSFSSEPIIEEKVVEEVTSYEEPSYKSYSSGSSYVAEEETNKSSFSSSSNYDSGSSSNYDSGSSSSDD